MHQAIEPMEPLSLIQPPPSLSLSVEQQQQLPLWSYLHTKSGFRLGIITSNAGTMSTADNPSCPNRFYTSGPTGVAAPSTSLTVPCASNIPNSSLIIEVTSASFSSDFYRYTSLTLPVNAQCSVGACVAGLPPSPLPPSSTPNTPPNPSPPKPSPPLPSPPPRPVLITSPSPSPTPQGNNSLKCDASVFGYQCQKVLSGATVHWSNGGKAPVNPCTSSSSSLISTNASSENLIHLAIESETSGYVGLGFSNTGNQMWNSDIVLGWISNNQATVNTWNIPSGDYYYITSGNPVTPSWTVSKGVWQGQIPLGSQITMVCFSRPLIAPSASVSSQLSAAQPLKLVYAAQVSGEQPNFGNPHTNRGGVSIDLLSGAAQAIDPKSNKNWVIIHGAMMAASVVLLFPSGVMMARHAKWILKDTKAGGVHLWFQLHRGVQIVAFIVFLIGISFAWAYLDISENLNKQPGISSCAKAHEILGNIVAGLIFLQVIFGFIRPHPGPGTLRSVWTQFHHWVGRLAIACTWTVVLLGIYIGHGSTAYLLNYSQWLIPVAVVMGLWVILDIVLSLLAMRLTKAESKLCVVVGPSRGQSMVEDLDSL